jgi:hypothetical protein
VDGEGHDPGRRIGIGDHLEHQRHPELKGTDLPTQ